MTQNTDSEKFTELERDLSSKWMIWIGGIALALGGFFLVKHSIDVGLLSPTMRLAFGVIFGLTLTPAGELIRRKRLDLPWVKNQPDYLPSAISAAGIFTLLASIYLAYGSYALLSPSAAFIALGIISLTASFVAIWQGRFFGYLGLIGGMIIPSVITSSTPNAWILFPYLLFILATSLYVARRQNWIDIVATSLGLATAWAIFWVKGSWHAPDVLPVGGYLLILGFLNAFLLNGASPHRLGDASASGILRITHPISLIADIVTISTLALLVSIVRLDHYGSISIAIFALGLISYLVATLKNADYDFGAIATLAASLFLLATWHLPAMFLPINTLPVNDPTYLSHAPILAPGFDVFVIAALVMAVGSALFIATALPRLLRKPLWSVIGTAFPVLVLIIAHGRLNNFDTNIPFAIFGIALSGFFALRAYRLSESKGFDTKIPMVSYIAGAILALALALSMALENAWLSFALSIEVAAIGFIWKRTQVDGLRKLAAGLALTVMVRLLLNSELFSYGAGAPLPIINWLFYGYGLSALLFAVSAKLFDAEDINDKLVSFLKTCSLLLLTAFTTLEIRVLLGGNGQIFGSITHWEIAVQTVNWATIGLIFYWRGTKDNNGILKLFSHVITAISIATLVFSGAAYNNILVQSIDVGKLPVLNLQLFQFLIPAVIYAARAHIARNSNEQPSATYYSIFSAFLAFAWISLEVRHLFYPMGGIGPISDWEWYGYSAAWLLYGAAVLMVGIRLEIRKVRIAGLLILALVIAKVFVLDMDTLEGIARALSFMGLGGMLIGMGYLYQKLSYRDIEPVAAENVSD